MKAVFLYAVYVVLTGAMLFAVIHKETMFSLLLQKTQTLQRQQAQLQYDIMLLTGKKEKLTNPTAMYQYAQKQNMVPIKLQQVYHD